MKFGTQVVLPKSYISTKFGTIRSKIEENILYTRIRKCTCSIIIISIAMVSMVINLSSTPRQ